jgi:hypothetical protein
MAVHRDQYLMLGNERTMRRASVSVADVVITLAPSALVISGRARLPHPCSHLSGCNKKQNLNSAAANFLRTPAK